MRFPALAVAALVALSGCHPAPQTLTIAVALLPSELSAYRGIVADFEHDSGWRVVVVPQQYADIRRGLAAEAFAGRGTLDLVELDVYSLAAAKDDVIDLTASDASVAVDALDPQVTQAGRFDGLRFLPHRVTWQAVIYNHAVLGKPPQTWDEVLAVARAHPQQIAIKASLYEGLTCDLLPFVWSAGGSGEVFDDEGARTALRWFAELGPYLHPQSATFKESTIAEAMARGEIVLHLNWPFAMSLYASQGLAPAIIRSAPLPDGPAGRATVLGGGYIGVPRHAPHRAEAIRLANFLVGRQAQQRFARELGWFSARRDVDVEGSSELLGGFTAMRAQVRPRPERADYARLSRLWQQALRAVLFEHADPDATLRAAQRTLDQGAPETSSGAAPTATATHGGIGATIFIGALCLVIMVVCLRWSLRHAPMATPLVVYLALVLVFPTLYAIKLAVTDSSTNTSPSFANFALLWHDPLFWRALLGNIVVPIGSVGVELVIGLAVALLLAEYFPGRAVLRAIVIIPFALPEIVFLTMMRYIFATRGYANAALVAAGLGPVEWLVPGRVAPWMTVVAVDAWHVMPVVYLMLLAALTGIPPAINDAAKLDGAGPVARFAFITLPLLRPALFAALLLRGIDALRVFATPLVLTGVEGVPVLSTYAYHQWSDYGNDGAAAGAASCLALLSVGCAMPLLRRALKPPLQSDRVK